MKNNQDQDGEEEDFSDEEIDKSMFARLIWQILIVFIISIATKIIQIYF